MKLKLNGSKTYGIALALIAYIAIQYFTGQPVEQEIIYGAMAAMGITIRHGIAKGEPKG